MLQEARSCPFPSVTNRGIELFFLLRGLNNEIQQQPLSKTGRYDFLIVGSAGWEAYTAARKRSERCLAACKFIGFTREFEQHYPESAKVFETRFESIAEYYRLW